MTNWQSYLEMKDRSDNQIQFTAARASRLLNHYSDKLLRDFWTYHETNPHIYERFVELAMRMRSSGRKYYSSKMIITVIRWETDLIGKGDEFKINDRFQSLYGRLLAIECAEFEDFFRFRVRGK